MTTPVLPWKNERMDLVVDGDLRGCGSKGSGKAEDFIFL
jgi:hypothetical protein